MNDLSNLLNVKNERPSTPQSKKIFPTSKTQTTLNKLNSLNEPNLNKILNRKDLKIEEENKKLRRTDFSSNGLNKDNINLNYLGNYRTNNPYANVSSNDVNNSLTNNSMNSNNLNVKNNSFLKNSKNNFDRNNHKKQISNSKPNNKGFLTKNQAAIIIQKKFRKYIKVNYLFKNVFD